MSPSQELHCANCARVVRGSDRYCPSCGAEAFPRRLTFRSALASGVEPIASLDAPLLRTFIDLCRFPGRVARAYCDGRRKVYSNPFKYNILTAVMLVAVVHFVLGGKAPTLPKGINTLPNTPAGQRVKDALTLSFKWNNDYLQWVYLLSLPVLAFLLWVTLGRRARRNVAEFYAMCLFGFAQIYLIQGVCVALASLPVSSTVGYVLGVVSGAAPFIYMPWMTVGFCHRGVIVEALASFLMFVVFSLFISMALFFLALAYVVWL